MDGSARSGLVVVVPESEDLLAEHRSRLDATAALGVPAHVTVLFPFLRSDDIDAPVVRRLTALFEDVDPFAYRFDRTNWFGDDVLWLAPDDPEPFSRLTRTVFAAFPAYPPFQGQFGDSVPHLTVGHGHSRTVLEQAERAVLPRLPVTGFASAVSLLVRHAGSARWSRHTDFGLGSVRSSRTRDAPST